MRRYPRLLLAAVCLALAQALPAEEPKKDPAVEKFLEKHEKSLGKYREAFGKSPYVQSLAGRLDDKAEILAGDPPALRIPLQAGSLVYRPGPPETLTLFRPDGKDTPVPGAIARSPEALRDWTKASLGSQGGRQQIAEAGKAALPSLGKALSGGGNAFDNSAARGALRDAPGPVRLQAAQPQTAAKAAPAAQAAPKTPPVTRSLAGRTLNVQFNEDGTARILHVMKDKKWVPFAEAKEREALAGKSLAHFEGSGEDRRLFTYQFDKDGAARRTHEYVGTPKEQARRQITGELPAMEGGKPLPAEGIWVPLKNGPLPGVPDGKVRLYLEVKNDLEKGGERNIFRVDVALDPLKDAKPDLRRFGGESPEDATKRIAEGKNLSAEDRAELLGWMRKAEQAQAAQAYLRAQKVLGEVGKENFPKVVAEAAGWMNKRIQAPPSLTPEEVYGKVSDKEQAPKTHALPGAVAVILKDFKGSPASPDKPQLLIGAGPDNQARITDLTDAIDAALHKAGEQRGAELAAQAAKASLRLDFRGAAAAASDIAALPGRVTPEVNLALATGKLLAPQMPEINEGLVNYEGMAGRGVFSDLDQATTGEKSLDGGKSIFGALSGFFVRQAVNKKVEQTRVQRDKARETASLAAQYSIGAGRFVAVLEAKSKGEGKVHRVLDIEDPAQGERFSKALGGAVVGMSYRAEKGKTAVMAFPEDAENLALAAKVHVALAELSAKTSSGMTQAAATEAAVQTLVSSGLDEAAARQRAARWLRFVESQIP